MGVVASVRMMMVVLVVADIEMVVEQTGAVVNVEVQVVETGERDVPGDQRRHGDDGHRSRQRCVSATTLQDLGPSVDSIPFRERTVKRLWYVGGTFFAELKRMDMTLFYVIAGVVLVFSLVVRTRMQATYNRWSEVRSVTGMVGGKVARTILDANGLQQVPVEPVQGKLTDHYDPRNDRLRLSKMNFLGNSVAATAVSAHECGHALQDATNYGPLALRSFMVPVANAGARFGLPLAIFGSLFGSSMMIMLGVLGYLGAILVHFMTLPVEFNASKRALQQLDSLGLVSEDGHEGAREVLRAAAMTYVAGVASSAGYILYLAFIGGRALFGHRRPPLPDPM